MFPGTNQHIGQRMVPPFEADLKHPLYTLPVFELPLHRERRTIHFGRSPEQTLALPSRGPIVVGRDACI
jgi:hypothetical protein